MAEKVTKNYLQLRNFNVKCPQEKLVLNSEMNFSQNYNISKESQTNEKTIAMLLVGMLTVSCGMVSASAADIGTSQSDQKTITIATC